MILISGISCCKQFLFEPSYHKWSHVGTILKQVHSSVYYSIFQVPLQRHVNVWRYSTEDQMMNLTFKAMGKRMMEKAIQKGCCHHWIPEHLAPVGKPQVGSQDHGPLFVAGMDQLEKQAGPTRGNRQKADLVDDQQRGMGIGAHLGLQPSEPNELKSQTRARQCHHQLLQLFP